MRIRNKLLFGFLTVSLIAVCIGGVSYLRLQEVVRPLQKDIPQAIEEMRELMRIDRSVQLMRYYQEVLFNCAQNYVMTKNVWWKQRYFAYKPELDSLIAEAVSKSQGKHPEIFQKIQTTHSRLMEMQKEILSNVDQQEVIQAEELLKKKEYWENKGLFENLVDNYFSQRGSQYERAFESSVIQVKIAAQKGRVILKNSLALTVLWLCVIVIIALLLGMWITDLIAQPIEALTRFTQGVGQGDFSKEIEIKSRDELGKLARAFNQMIKDLAANREKLVRQERLASMGKLAGIISHEIRNPLAGIANSVYFLKMKLEKNPDEKIAKHLRILEEEVTNAEVIIEDTLDFAREKEPSLEKSDISEVLQKALGRKTIPQNIKVEKNIHPGIPSVMLDVSQMTRVFYNLIWNAVQAMPNGGQLKTTVEKAKRGDEGRAFVKVSLIDSGSGISEENLKQIFEPLFTTKPKGTGLGLSVCQNIVKGHKGMMEVQSLEGKGTTFTIWLPAAE